MSSPFDQSTYQVRFDWGADGLARLAAADVYVVVDVIGFSSRAAAAVRADGTAPLGGAPDAPGDGRDADDGAALARAAAAQPHTPLVIAGALRNASAVARAIRAEQERRGGRTFVAVLAAGERDPRSAGIRFAVEDQLGAGAIIDALAALGIDHSSPEAVVAAESFVALRRAVRHLLTASGSGRARADMRDEVRAAAAVDDLDVVPVVRDGALSPL